MIYDISKLSLFLLITTLIIIISNIVSFTIPTFYPLVLSNVISSHFLHYFSLCIIRIIICTIVSITISISHSIVLSHPVSYLNLFHILSPLLLDLIVCVDEIAASGGYMMASVANTLVASHFSMLVSTYVC